MNTPPERQPRGEISLQTVAMPADTNWNGDIFGGWLLAQMDLAGAVMAQQRAQGRVATVAIEGMSFLQPVAVGTVIRCHTEIVHCGRTSLQIAIEVWGALQPQGRNVLLTEGRYTYVAIDEHGRKRQLPTEAHPDA